MLLAFNIILDDIVFPDGRTAMGVLGGGGPQAAFGMRLVAEQVGLVAEVGADLPEAEWAWLNASGIDTTGVRVNGQRRTPRAWQVTEDDGRRTQVWRVRPESPFSLDSLPNEYRYPTGVHFGIHPESPPLAMASAFRQAGAVVSVELFRAAGQRPGPEALFEILAMADIFSATLPEAQSLVGEGSPRSVMRRLVEAAESRAMLMVLRMGEAGSLAAEGQTGQVVQVPAVPVVVQNVVGAGNAYCGGFLAGWVASRSLTQAAACGAVAASFAVAQLGLPVVAETVRTEARKKIDALMPKIDYTSL